MYRKKARFVVGGKTLNLSRFGAREPTIIERKDIHEAARQGGPKLVAKLADSGVDINGLDADGMTPVWLAAMKGHHRVVGVLADRGANLDVLVDNFERLSPLMIAATNGHHKAVSVLVAKGANIDLQSDLPVGYVGGHVVGLLGQTALMVAAQSGHLGVVRLLIERGANLDLVDWDGNSALMVAAQSSDLEVVCVLVEMGANLELIDEQGQTALMLATDQAQAQELETVRLLIAKGANIDHTDRWGWTPVFVAAQNDNPEMVRLLIASGANLDLAGEDGTPLDVAIASRHQGVIDVIDAFERHRIARIKRSVRSLTRQDPSKVKVPKEMDGVIGSFLIS